MKLPDIEGKLDRKVLMSQVIGVNQFLGVFPLQMCGTNLIFRWTSLSCIKTLLNLTILCIYLVYLSVQLVHGLDGATDILILTQIWYWMALVSIPIFILVLCLVKRQDFTLFFESSVGIQPQMKKFIDTNRAIVYSRRIYKFYVLMAIASTLLFGIEFYWRPNKAASPLFHVPEPSTVMIIAGSLFQMYLILISSAALSFVEVLCPALAISIASSIDRVREALMAEVREINLLTQTEVNAEAYVATVAGVGDENDKSRPVAILAELGRMVKPRRGCVGHITKALERYGFIAEQQGAINCIFGTILALNTAWLVTSVCLLLFMEIRILSPRSGQMSYEGMLPIRLALIVGNCVTCSIRLSIVLIAIGRVYHASKCFEGSIIGSLLRVDNPKSQELHLINIQLLSYQMSPVAFSAGGFFIFSRVTILYVLSIVTTYLVFLLQA